MVKKSSLAKKLASYSAVAAAVLITDKNASAQIVYTQLSPFDTVGTGYNSYYQLDLNNDGIYDFEFIEKDDTVAKTYNGFQATYYRIICYPHSSNKILDAIVPTALNYGDTISARKNYWNNERVFGSIKCIFDYCFHNSSDTVWYNKERYIGLKILKNGNTYYGWARLEVNYQTKRVPGYNGFNLVIKDYAYNSIPDSSIYAGEKCTQYYPRPSLQIKNDTLSTNATTHIQWTINNKPISGDTTQNIALSQYGLYQVREGDTTQCYVVSATYNYIDCNTYKPNIGSPTQIFCANTTMELQIDTIPVDYSVQWFQNNTLLQGNTSQILETYSSSGNYFALVYEQNGCYDTSNVVDVVVDTTFISGGIIQHGDTLFGEEYYHKYPANVTYEWADSTGVSFSTNYYIIISTSGTYYLSVSDSNLCSAFYYGYYSTTGINHINPADILIGQNNNLLNIKFNSTPYIGYKMVIYNYLGKQVYTTEITSGNMMIDLNSLARGLYLVTLENDNSRVVKKIVLQ